MGISGNEMHLNILSEYYCKLNRLKNTLRILSPGCNPCNDAGLPGCTAVTNIPAKLPPVNRIPTEPSLWNVTNLASGLKETSYSIIYITRDK